VNGAVDERVPPFDVTAERHTLGSMLVSERAIPDVVRVLGVSGRKFYRPAHQLIYEAILAVHERGQVPDPVVVADELTKRGDLARAGGAPYLADLYGSVPTVTNATAYAQIVADRYNDRSLLQLSASVSQAAWEGHPDRAHRLISQWLEQQATEDAGDGPAIVTLDAFLAEDDEPVRYRVDRLWPVGGRVVLAAQYKAGKTTLRDNLVRCLADAEDFLGRFPVAPPQGRIVVIDNELDTRMMRAWLRDQQIANPGRVAVLPLRGKVAAFDLLDGATRARWASKLRAVGAAVVIFDCLRPVLDALGLDESKEAGRFLVAFDALLDEAGIGEALLVHHMGHNGERSRGDSRLLDWPDVTWRLVRQNEDPASARFFSAFGRDVDQGEGLLTFDRERRRLTLTGQTRRDTAADAFVPLVVDTVTAEPGISQNTLTKRITGDVHKILAARDRAVKEGLIHIHDGRNRSKLHYPGPPGAVGCCGGAVHSTGAGGVGAVYRQHHHRTTTDTTGAPQHHTTGRALDCAVCGHPLDSKGHEINCETAA